MYALFMIMPRDSSSSSPRTFFFFSQSLLTKAGIDVPCRDVGIPREFLDQGSVAQVKAAIGLTAQDVARTLLETVSRQISDPADTADRA